MLELCDALLSSSGRHKLCTVKAVDAVRDMKSLILCFSRRFWGLECIGLHFGKRYEEVNVARCLQYKVGSYRYVVDRWTQRGIT